MSLDTQDHDSAHLGVTTADNNIALDGTTTTYHLGDLFNDEKIRESEAENIISSASSLTPDDQKNRRSESSHHRRSTDRRKSEEEPYQQFSQQPTFNYTQPPANPDAYKNITDVNTVNLPAGRSTAVPGAAGSYSVQTGEKTAGISAQKAEIFEKLKLLRLFRELKKKGIETTEHYDLDSNLDDMKVEYSILKGMLDKEQGTKWYKELYIWGVQFMEFFNERYNPFDLELNGLHNQLSVTMDDTWDDIFAELYEKYSSKGKKMEPEIKLLLLTTMQATAYHAARSEKKNNAMGMAGAMLNNPTTTKFIEQQVAGNKKQQDWERKEQTWSQQAEYAQMNPQQQKEYQMRQFHQQQFRNAPRVSYGASRSYGGRDCCCWCGL